MQIKVLKCIIIWILKSTVELAFLKHYTVSNLLNLVTCIELPGKAVSCRQGKLPWILWGQYTPLCCRWVPWTKVGHALLFCFSFQCVAKPYAASPHAVVHDVCDILIKLKIKRKKVNNVIASYKTNLYCSLYSAPQHPQCNMAAGVNKPLVRKKIVSVGLREGS